MKKIVFLLLSWLLLVLPLSAQNEQEFKIPAHRVEKYRENVRRFIDNHYFSLKELLSTDEEMVQNHSAYQESFLYYSFVTDSRTYVPEFFISGSASPLAGDDSQYLLELQKEYASIRTEALEFSVSDFQFHPFYKPDDFSCYTYVDYTLTISLQGQRKAVRQCRAYCLFPTATDFVHCRLWQIKPMKELMETASSGQEDVQQAIAYYKQSAYDKAFPLFVYWAQRGDAEAQCYLGSCYDAGRGTNVNKDEAFKWFKKAAEQENPLAQGLLGICYENGTGTSIHPNEAFKWYKKAAEQGLAAAQCNLGWCYCTGFGTDVNETEAFKWYKIAAQQGNAKAQYNLGLCYEFGKGTSINKAEAVKWYQKAAAQGNKDAEERLRLLGTSNQLMKVTGKVTDTHNEPLMYASVKIRGTNKGTVTDRDGNYTIEASVGDILQFSFVGYRVRNIKVTESTHHVILREE